MFALKSYRKLHGCKGRRLFSTTCITPSSIEKLPPPLSSPPQSGFTHLTSRSLIYIWGRDSAQFLQGLTTANIPSSVSSSPRGFYSAFLNAQGRVLHDIFIYPATTRHVLVNGSQGPGPGNTDTEQGFMIEVDANETDILAKWLKRYKLRAKISILKIEDDEWGVYSAWSSRDNSFLHSSSGLPIDSSSSPALLTLDNRAPSFGLRVLLPVRHSAPRGNAILLQDNQLTVGDQVLNECSIQQYHVRRILHGIPEGQSEIQKEHALPLESNLDYMLGVDFRKGCYVGQELTIRTHHTGVVRKRILPVMLYPSGEGKKPEELLYEYEEGTIIHSPPPGVQHSISPSSGKSRSVGKWLGGIGNLGLALCRLETMIGGQDEFKMQWEDVQGNETKEVRVKAFIPKWHQQREAIVGLKKV